jgi:hypothetical protein
MPRQFAAIASSLFRRIVVMRPKHYLLLVFLASCSRESGSSPRSAGSSSVKTTAADRRWVAATFDTVWTLGGNDADTVLAFPARLISTDSLIILSDPGTHRILALRPADGTIAWMTGPQGGHPFRRAFIMWAQPGGRIAVVDEEIQRVTSIDARGRIVGEMDLDPSYLVDDLCALDGRDPLVTSASRPGPLYTLAADGKTATPVPFTVLDAKGHDPLVLQANLARTRDGKACVLATSFGGGLARWDGRSFTASTRYREDIPYPVPVMHTSTRVTATGKTETTYPTMPPRAIQSALDVATVAGRVRVLFYGTTAAKGTIVDDYDDRTLEYLGSVRLPFAVSEFATPSPDLIVALTLRNGFPMVIALRQRAGGRR